MNTLTFLILSLFTLNAFAADETRTILHEYHNECRNTEVKVDEIVKNSHIKGHIVGLPSTSFEKFKVVFYVKTNRWYIHPYSYYEGQEQGYSYSNIDANGHFKVKTVRRDVPSKEMAVVVVPRSYKIHRQKFWLRPLFGVFGGVLKHQCNHTIVKGNGDFY